MSNAVKGLKRGPHPAAKRSKAGQAGSTSVQIGPDGGTIDLSEQGVSIKILPGTLSREHSFSVRADGSIYGVEVEVSPSAELQKPAVISIEVDQATKDKGDAFLCGVDSISERVLAQSIHRVQYEGNKAVARVKHFSGYIIACGIQMGQPCNPEQDGPDCIWVD